MIERVKSLLSEWKITIAVVGGALVIGTVWGTCTLDPEVADAGDAAETTTEEATIEAEVEEVEAVNTGENTVDMTNATETNATTSETETNPVQ